MISLKDYLKSELEGQSEIQIYVALAALMSKRQFKQLEYERPLNLKERSGLRGDMYAPEGIEGLKIERPTMIEAKSQLLLPTFQRELSKGMEYVQIHEGEVYLVVYAGSALSIPVNPAKNVFFRRYDELLDILEERKPGNDARVSERGTNERKDLIAAAAKALKRGHVTFILGAGVSVDAGSPTWGDLLRGLIKKNGNLFPLGKDEDDYRSIVDYCGHSPLITARYVIGDLEKENNKEDLIKEMRKLIYRRKECDYKNPSAALPVIAKIIKDCNVESAITFNYDEFLEEALKKERKKSFSYYDKGALGRSFPVFHVHGLVTRDINGASTYPVLSEREYHSLYSDGFHWSNVEILHALMRNTCFFVGLSMLDPNLRRLLDIAQYGDEEEHQHYLFLRRTPLKKQPDIEYDEKHQKLLEQQFIQMGVNVIWFDYNPDSPHDYTDLATKLNEIYEKAIEEPKT